MKYLSSLVLALSAAVLMSCADPAPTSESTAPQKDVPAAKKHMPKVVLDGTNKTFIDANGKPFVPCGVSYYRPGRGLASAA